MNSTAARILFLPLLLLWGGAAQVSAQNNDIFAEFQTSMGTFTCRLEHVLAPKTVASFIGLATGERSWIDITTGRVRNDRFYDGITFHRVITNFMNQSGSRNGNGNDGPGYTFEDEFSSELKHDTGTLSMANPGTAHANGAQFFITVTNTYHLDGKHSIFGKVVGGMDVVRAINRVATTNDKPITPVYLETVRIRRVGLATNFNIHAQGLGVCTNVPLQIDAAGTNVHLAFLDRPNVVNKMFSSSDLATWKFKDSQFDNTAPTNRVLTEAQNGAATCYRLAQVQYTQTAPGSLKNRDLMLDFGKDGKVYIKFDNAGGGTFRYTMAGSGKVVSYSYGNASYMGALWPISFDLWLRPMYLGLKFDSAGAGTFTGQTLAPLGWVNLAGTFTLSAPSQ